MTQEHPITPPLELIREWALNHDYTYANELWDYIATQAARWGADQELEACCTDIHAVYGKLRAEWLRSMRRPKLLSLKKQALALLDDASDRLDAAHENTIRRALEQLND